MASTNKTTNYQLSQFTATDKPAWLGDYNQDMNKIDTQMKANADSSSTVSATVAGHTTAISGITSDVQTLQNNVNSLSDEVANLQTADTSFDSRITTAQNSADTANGKADTNASNIATNSNDISALQLGQTDLETSLTSTNENLQTALNEIKSIASELNLSEEPQIATKDNFTGVSHLYSLTRLTLMQSPNSSLFKMYGRLDFGGTSGAKSIPKTQVTGLSGYYGFKTTLKLNVPPKESYLVSNAGSTVQYTPGGDPGARALFTDACNFAVDTDGYIWVGVSTANTLQFGSYVRFVQLYYAELYFNTSFGDIIQPEE